MSPMDFPTVTATRKSPALVSVDGRTYPLRSATIRAHASGGVAATTLIQEFSNPHDEALEVLYTLPLPADGAVLGYTIHVGERVIRGEIEPREKAEKEYREALYAGKTAGLLEEDRADTFSQRLGNIPPHTDVRVEIEVLQRLAFLAALPDIPARWEYRFPTVTTVRYQGQPGRVPDVERISPDRAGVGEIPTRFDLHLTIADESAAEGEIDSPSHRIRHDRTAGATILNLEEGSPLDKDLVIRWRAAIREVGVHLTEGVGLPGDDGRYALLTITPPDVPAATFRRDLTILLDTSGSMSGAPLETAKRVVTRLLESLAPNDRFEVLEFSHQTRRLMNDLVPATPAEIKQCLAALKNLKADGGTEMTQALLEALKPKDLEAQRQVVLVTDGQIGFEKEARDAVLREGAVVSRVHVVGIGLAPNRALTMALARAGRGSEVFASSAEGAEEAVRGLIAATASPVLVGLEVGGTAVHNWAPQRPPDVFAGRPVVMAVALNPDGGTVEVTGRLAGSADRWIWRMEVPARTPAAASETGTMPIGALYGREHIQDIEALAETEADRFWIDSAIEKTAMRHRIVSRLTSLVAVADEPSVDPLAPRRRERLPVEVPWGMSVEGLGLQRSLFSFGHIKGAFSSAPLLSRGDMVNELRRNFVEAPTRFVRTIPPDKTPISVSGTLVRLDHDRLLLEFRVPMEGFRLSASDWALVTGSPDDPRHFRQTLRLVQGESAHLGPHVVNTLVRVMLRSASGGNLHPVTNPSWVTGQGLVGVDWLKLEIQFEPHA
jgi:Ca-activated chloride channel homolog